MCPATGYAGDYIWNGDAKTGSLEILKHNHIPQEEWQMGTTKVFIRHPETIFALETLRDRYWHNMATRIQRAWRAYVRYKHDCAKKIQRFWRQNKYNIGYLQMRDYGHQILGGQKERRRYSLVSMRRFTGDYLDIKSGSGFAAMVRGAISFTGNEQVVFSMRGSTLVPRAMRSSVPSPRTLVLTNQNLHVVVATQRDKVLSMADEKVISLNNISGISVSTLQDDWVIIHLNSSPEGDAIISCMLKTEMLAHILQQTGGRVKVSVLPQIPYKKKGGKSVTMKFIKDETAKGDGLYKSHVVKICSGAPPGSQSNPPCAVKPRPTKNATRRAAAAAASAPRANNNNNVRSAPRPSANKAGPVAMGRSAPPPSPPPAAAAAAAPPPPPPPAAPSAPQYKAIYPFKSQEAGEIEFEKGDLLEIIEKDENGWWMARKDSIEGWVPSNYLEEYVPPKPVAVTPPPPPPPARRAPPSIPTQSRSPIAPAAPAASANSGVPAWKAELEARKANSATSSPVPAARRTPPAPGQKPVIPAKPAIPAKPIVPSRPGAGAPTPAPRAPSRVGANGSPSNAAASLADAVS